MAKIIKDLSTAPLKVMAYGRGGTGKTSLVGSAAEVPEMSPVLMLTLHGNPRSLRRLKKQPTVVQMSELKEFNDFYTFFEAGQPDTHPLWALLHLKEPYKTLIIDGTSTYQQYVLDAISDRHASDRFDVIGADLKPGDFKKNVDTMYFFGDKFVGLAEPDNKFPVHVLMTALEHDPAIDFRSAADRAAGVKGPSVFNQTYRPYFFGQATGIMEGLVEILVRMLPVQRVDVREIGGTGLDKKDHYNVGIFQPGPDYQAKDQASNGRLPGHLYDPTMRQIYDAVYGK